jgi:hypothetical protein
MNILINQRFRQDLEKKKDTLKPYQVVELENFFLGIEKKPEEGEQIGETDYYKKSYVSSFVCIIVYQYNSKKGTLIFWSLE